MSLIHQEVESDKDENDDETLPQGIDVRT